MSRRACNLETWSQTITQVLFQIKLRQPRNRHQTRLMLLYPECGGAAETLLQHSNHRDRNATLENGKSDRIPPDTDNTVPRWMLFGFCRRLQREERFHGALLYPRCVQDCGTTSRTGNRCRTSKER